MYVVRDESGNAPPTQFAASSQRPETDVFHTVSPSVTIWSAPSPSSRAGWPLSVTCASGAPAAPFGKRTDAAASISWKSSVLPSATESASTVSVCPSATRMRVVPAAAVSEARRRDEANASVPPETETAPEKPPCGLKTHVPVPVLASETPASSVPSNVAGAAEDAPFRTSVPAAMPGASLTAPAIVSGPVPACSRATCPATPA